MQGRNEFFKACSQDFSQIDGHNKSHISFGPIYAPCNISDMIDSVNLTHQSKLCTGRNIEFCCL